MAEFSVLLPVYAGDTDVWVERAIRSVTVDQTRPPAEVVVVRDGPVGDGLAEVLARAARGELTGGVGVRVVALAENVGLARALCAGLDACGHEIVARADADDVSLPERFAVQVPLVEAGLDLVSSAIVEFAGDENVRGLVRGYPTDAAELAALARTRDPFNHPAVVYRRAAVAAAGGYEHLDKMEDYWLFARMIHAGARVGNVAQPLVLYRVNGGAYARRGGWRMLRSEMILQTRMLRLGFTTPLQFARNVVVRGLWRFVPTGLRQRVYRLATPQPSR